MKQCTHCNLWKPLSEYSSNGRKGKRSECKPCFRIKRNRYHELNKKRARDNERSWKLANPEANKLKNIVNVVARRETKRKAMPRWLSPEHKQKIKEIYKEALKSNLVVDHTVPLKGKWVCGLHVPWNMQLITREENSIKSNRHESDNYWI